MLLCLYCTMCSKACTLIYYKNLAIKMLSYPYSAIKHDVSFRTIKGDSRGENGAVALPALKVGSKLPSFIQNFTFLPKLKKT